MNLGWTLRRTSPAAVVMLMVGGLFLVSAAQAPRTQDASFDMPFMMLPAEPVSLALPAPTTTTTAAATPTPVTPIVFPTTPPDGRKNLGGDKHAMTAHPAFGMLVIQRIGLVHPVFEGIEEAVFHWGPGHWPGSALPGQRGNTVFAGHRVTHTRPFLDIDRLRPGDRIVFHLATGTFTYEVTGHIIVGPKDIWIADQTPDATVTLFGCHPKYSARQRYVVRGSLVSSEPYRPF